LTGVYEHGNKKTRRDKWCKGIPETTYEGNIVEGIGIV
jgi:hypothetical protein